MVNRFSQLCFLLLLGFTPTLHAHTDTPFIPPENRIEYLLELTHHSGRLSAKGETREAVAAQIATMIEGYKYSTSLWHFTDLNVTFSIPPQSSTALFSYTTTREYVAFPDLFASPVSSGLSGYIHGGQRTGCDDPLFPDEEDIDSDGDIDHCHAIPDRPLSCDAKTAGVNLANGEITQSFSTDLNVGSGSLPITYTRQYNTQRPIANGTMTSSTSLVAKTAELTETSKPEGAAYVTSNFDKSITKNDEQQTVYLRRPGGRDFWGSINGFEFSGGLLKRIATGWEILTKKDIREEYNQEGRLIMLEHTSGAWQKLEYDTNNQLTRVLNDQAYDINFVYNGQGLVESIEKPDGNKVFYQYDELGRQTSMTTSNDNVTETYLYENTAQPYLLTAIVDGKGVRYVEWEYNEEGRAISRQFAGDTNKSLINYLVGGASVTNGNGHVKTVNFNFDDGSVFRVVGKSCSTDNVNGEVTYSGINPIIKTDEKGIKTLKSYVGYSQRLDHVIEAYGTADARTTQYSYDPIYGKVSEIVYPNGLTVNYTYGLNGRVESYSESGVDLTTRLTTYHYNENNLLASIDGPRTDVSDITTYEYDSRRRLVKVINALGHTTEFLAFDANGNVTQTKGANGSITEMIYDAKGQVTQIKVGESTTDYVYDNVGQLLTVTLGNGSSMNYVYDDARRLTSITDSLNNRIEFTVDAEGNITQKNVKDSNGLLRQTQSFVYDQINRLQETISADYAIWKKEYDVSGNVIKTIDPRGEENNFQYDALKRLSQQTDPLGGETTLGYNLNDETESVTDAINKSTQYDYNVVGEVTKLTSPDTGITTFTHNSAGNVTSKTDARGITVTYTYDALNRVKTESYSDASENKTYTYDDTTNGNKGIGRLTSVTDQSGSTHYVYNGFGQVTKATQIIQGNTYSTDYQFDDNGQLISMTYPNGRVLNYGYDVSGRFNQLTTSFDGVSQTLVSGLEYLPFGPMTNLNYGNGLALNKNYDLDYRLKDQSTTGLNPISYGYDLTDNITTISNQSEPNKSQDLTYDNLSRLLSGQGQYGDLLYSYDKVGNRLSQSSNSETNNYQYASDSHQLNYVMASQVTEFTLDPAGNTLTKGDLVFTYNQQGRMSTASNSNMNTSYLYNFKGERVSKEVNGTQTYFIFGLQGQLIAEANAQGEVLKQYYYVNGEPYAMEVITDQAAPSTPQLTEVIFDDTDAALYGNWQNSTSVSGYTGAGYVFHAANAPASNGVILDNDQATLVGDWRTSTSVAGYWGSDYSFHAANQPAGGEIFDSEDANTTVIGSWSTSTSVAGYNASNYLAGAAGQGEKQVTWNLSSLNSADYQVYARWTSHSNRASNATYQVSHNNGQSSVTVNQKTNGNQWVLIGNYNLDVNSSITIDNNADGYVIADAIMVVPVGASANAATWQWQADNSDTYLVYARWTAHANRASNATYTVTSDSGVSQSVIANQKQNGSQWNLLTTITLNQGETLSVDLTGRADGYVIADAIQIVSASDNTGNTAEWSMANVQSGEYEVYANWTQHANRATNALFNITHQNGSDTVSVNQTQNGGSWQLLGTYDINSASTISLTDVANGYVIADGIKLVPTNTSSNAQVGGIYYYHNSHLGTPEVMTDESQNIVWQASYTPFGKATVEVNTVENNIRFPGQYFDAETGLHYNYFRDYDPEIGRYIQSDPIGLAGGINTYGYVGGNPINFYDPKGLAAIPFPFGPGGIPIPPVAIPGTPANDRFVNAMRDMINDVARTIGRIGEDDEECGCPDSSPNGPYYRYEVEERWVIQAYTTRWLYGRTPLNGGSWPTIQAYRIPQIPEPGGRVKFCTSVKPAGGGPILHWYEDTPGVTVHDEDTIKIPIHPLP